MLILKMFAKVFYLLCPLVQAHPITIYDQSQTGDLNVQVDLKDIQIIALLKSAKEEYVDYDYAYDYSEMTIKPQNGTTAKPLNATGASIHSDNTTKATTSLLEITTEPTKNVSEVVNDATTPETLKNTSLSTTKNVSELTTSSPSSATIPEPITTTIMDTRTDTTASLVQNNLYSTSINGTNCKKGFAANQKGDCALKIQATGNALMKLVKLSQKLKLRRENRTNQSVPTKTQ